MKKILVVEDNEELGETMGEILRGEGFAVVLAAQGEEAVQKAREERPDLIIMDIMLPGMDGTEAARIIREDPLTSRTPIVFLTGLKMNQDSASGEPDLSADFPVLGKPINGGELIRIAQKMTQA